MDKGTLFCKLVHLAEENGIFVSFAPLPVSKGRWKGDKIVIRQNLPTIDDYNYNLAHELAHIYLHYDKGNILPWVVGEKMSAQYEEQADRAAKMLLEALSIGGAA